MTKDDTGGTTGADSRHRLSDPVVQDAIFSAILALLSIILLINVWSSEWGATPTTDPLGVRFVPTLALAAILIGLAIFWLEYVRGKVRNTSDLSWQIHRSLLLGVCGLAYFVLTFRLGIILGLLISLPLLLWLTGYRDLRKSLLLTLGFGLFTYVMFGRVLDVFLPRALWL